MKQFPILLLNLTVVVIGIVVYDQLRSEPAAPAGGSGGNDTGTAALEERLDALEAERRRTRRPGGVDPGILGRLAALEASMGAPPLVPADPDTWKRADGESPTDGPRTSPTESWDEPSREEIKRFRMLQEAVRREEAVKKNKYRVEAALERLPFGLSDEQRAKIHSAFAAFEPRIDRLWGEAKARAQDTIAAGGDVDRTELYTSTMATIQEEFAATLEGVVPPADATAVAEILLPSRK